MADDSKVQRISFRVPQFTYSVLVKGDEHHVTIQGPKGLEKLEKLKRYLRQTHGTRGGRGRVEGSRNYSPEYRRWTVEEYMRYRRGGLTQEAASGRVGHYPVTLRKWAEELGIDFI